MRKKPLFGYIIAWSSGWKNWVYKGCVIIPPGSIPPMERPKVASILVAQYLEEFLGWFLEVGNSWRICRERREGREGRLGYEYGASTKTLSSYILCSALAQCIYFLPLHAQQFTESKWIVGWWQGCYHSSGLLPCSCILMFNKVQSGEQGCHRYIL